MQDVKLFSGLISVYTEITEIFDDVPAWGAMWSLAIAIFAALKTITWWPWRRRASVTRSIGYLIGWPGMNAAAFFARRGAILASATEFVSAALQALLGAALILLVPR